MDVKSTVSFICNTCQIDYFQCERSDWCKDKINIPKCGPVPVCPLTQFEAEENTDKRTWFERLLTNDLPEITVDDTWRVCSKCKYAKVTKDGISINDCLFDVCLDCPVFQAREALEENEAEC